MQSCSHDTKIYVTLTYYYKQQKLCMRKVSRSTEFHSNVGIAFMIFVLKVLSLLKALAGKTFAIHQKFVKIAKLFSRLASFWCLWYAILLPCSQQAMLLIFVNEISQQ